MSAEKETIRVTLGVGLILAVLSIAPETVKFYLSARSIDREADLKANAFFVAWAGQQAAWGIQIEELEKLRGEKQMRELDASLPPLPPDLDAFALDAAKRFDFELESLRFNMRIAEHFNRPTRVSPNSDAEVETLNEQIDDLQANPIIDRGFHMSLAQSTDEAIAFAKAKRLDLAEAKWFVGISGLLHALSFGVGCYLIFSGMRARLA